MILIACRVFTIGQNNLTAYLQSAFGAVAPALIPQLEAAYPIGSNGLETDYDVISQIVTELTFQCVSQISDIHCVCPSDKLAS